MVYRIVDLESEGWPTAHTVFRPYNEYITEEAAEVGAAEYSTERCYGVYGVYDDKQNRLISAYKGGFRMDGATYLSRKAKG